MFRGHLKLLLDKYGIIRYNKGVAGFAPHIELLRIRPPGWEIPAIWELRFGFNHGGELPRHFHCGDDSMKTLSVFIDESGDTGPYDHRSPFYLVSMVFHDQSRDIAPNLHRLQSAVQLAGYPNCMMHAGPLIRREKEFVELTMPERKCIFNCLYNFTRTTDITYHTIAVEKKQLQHEFDLLIRLSKSLFGFLREHQTFFQDYDRVIVYYDHGQNELNSILVNIFGATLNNVEFRKVVPADYKLFQAADMLCSLELLALKAESKTLSRSELAFFSSARDFYKSYLNAIRRKQI